MTADQTDTAIDSIAIEAHTTCASADVAHRIALAAVEQRLCAYAHITPTDTIYRWDDTVHQSHQTRLTFGTTTSQIDALKALIDVEHNADLPPFWTTPIFMVRSPRYEQWIIDNSTP